MRVGRFALVGGLLLSLYFWQGYKLLDVLADQNARQAAEARGDNSWSYQRVEPPLDDRVVGVVVGFGLAGLGLVGLSSARRAP